MASEKGIYWLSVAVMVVVLGNSTPMGWVDWVGNLQDRALELADAATSRATGYLSVAEMEFSGNSPRCLRTQTSAIRLQTQLARMQSEMARGQAGLARLQAGRARMQARAAC